MGSRPGREGAAAAGVVAALVISSCVSGAEPRSAPPVPAPVTPELAEVWRNTALHPIAQPKAVGAVAVGIVSTADRKLLVVALDPATGAERWRQPVTPSGITAGVSVDFEKIGEDRIAYLRPMEDDLGVAELVIADARTGDDLVKTPPALFSSPAEVCGDSRDVCVLVRGRNRSVQFRVDGATGAIVSGRDELPLRTRLLDKGVLDLGDRPGNTLAFLRDGKMLWSTPVSAAFPPGFSSDNGWSWRLFADRHVLVGSVYGEPKIVGDKYIRDRASTSATAGFSEHTGEVLWRDRGSTLHCFLGEPRREPRHPVRCRVRGTLTSQPDGAIAFEDLDVTVEGFDVLTGQATWSMPLGNAPELAGASARPPVAGETQVVLQAPRAPMVLDYATGAVTIPSPDATFWCMTLARYELSRPHRSSSGAEHHSRPGGNLATICDRRGHTATKLPSVTATRAVGASIGRHVVIATRDGYVGYQARLPAR